MKVMVVGGGGREHAIIKKLKENKTIEEITDYALSMIWNEDRTQIIKKETEKEEDKDAEKDTEVKDEPQAQDAETDKEADKETDKKDENTVMTKLELIETETAIFVKEDSTPAKTDFNFEKASEVIVPYLADESGFHAEDSRASDGVGSRASCYELYSHRFQCPPDLVACLHIDMLHAAFREVELLEKRIIRKDGKNIRQCISDT